MLAIVKMSPMDELSGADDLDLRIYNSAVMHYFCV